MTDTWTLAQVKAYQDTHGLRDEHVVYIGETGFHLAHTDTERASISLEDCPVHHSFMALDEAPAEPGLYRVGVRPYLADWGPPKLPFYLEPLDVGA